MSNTGVATLSDLTFDGTDAWGGRAISNGDSYTPSGTMTVDDSAPTDNRASGVGGGIDNRGTLTASLRPATARYAQGSRKTPLGLWTLGTRSHCQS